MSDTQIKKRDNKENAKYEHECIYTNTPTKSKGDYDKIKEKGRGNPQRKYPDSQMLSLTQTLRNRPPGPLNPTVLFPMSGHRAPKSKWKMSHIFKKRMALQKITRNHALLSTDKS